MSPRTQLRLVPPPANVEVATDLQYGSRQAQRSWQRLPIRDRLAIIRELRYRIAEHSEDLASSVRLPQRSSRAETLAAEVLPLADACRFLEREAATLLAPQRPGRRGRPFWLAGSQIELRREPLGLILILGPANYPLFLPGVQILQALLAGNAVVVKPGRYGLKPVSLLADLLRRSGLPEGLLTVLDESPRAAAATMAAGVDKVFLTGSATTGRAVLQQLAPDLTPAVMELSGCDPVFVRDDADLDLVARALRFGMTFNGSFTCIAPRRVFVSHRRLAELEEKLIGELSAVAPVPIDTATESEVCRSTEEALAWGARLSFGALPSAPAMRPLVLADTTPAMAVHRADVAAPLLALCAVDDDQQALRLAELCPYQLGAAVFGEPSGARALAERVGAGVVVVNDLVVPTADPRVPFGGRKKSGFGVTRGAEGLLEMTQVKTVILRHGRFRPHFDPAGPEEEGLLSAFVQIAHGRTLGRQLKAVLDAAKTLIQRPAPGRPTR